MWIVICAYLIISNGKMGNNKKEKKKNEKKVPTKRSKGLQTRGKKEHFKQGINHTHMAGEIITDCVVNFLHLFY